MDHPTGTSGQKAPADQHIIAQIVKSMGIEEVENRVIPQLLEFMHRYVREVLEDATIYASHASKASLDLEDVRLAIQSRVNYSFTQPPPREFLIELAHSKNAIPLPFPPLPPLLSAVSLPPPQFRVKPLEWGFALPPCSSLSAAAAASSDSSHSASSSPIPPPPPP